MYLEGHPMARRNIETQIDGPPPRILIIDDDERFLKLLKTVLEKNGMVVFTAINADDGRKQIISHLPEVIVSDLLMPGTQGDVLCKELQDDPSTASIPFIFVSAVKDPEARVSSIEKGAMDFLVKPIYMDELVARILSQVRKNRTLRIRLLTDPLTGVKNRWYFEEELPRLVRQAKRHDWKMGIIIIDINEFKKINDTFSHAAGDIVLCSVAKELVKVFRTSDVIIRYGGDEFVIILPETAKEDGIIALNRLFAIFEHYVLSPRDGTRITVKLAAGLACYPDDGETIDSVFDKADMALYAVKKAAKNGYAISGDEEKSRYF